MTYLLYNKGPWGFCLAIIEPFSTRLWLNPRKYTAKHPEAL